jgi:hypothetical protein
MKAVTTELLVLRTGDLIDQRVRKADCETRCRSGTEKKRAEAFAPRRFSGIYEHHEIK